MNVNVSKIMKVLTIGVALHYSMNFCYDLGKGRMLGTLAKDCPEINESMQYLSDWKPDKLSDRLKLAIVIASAKLKMEEP